MFHILSYESTVKKSYIELVPAWRISFFSNIDFFLSFRYILIQTLISPHVDVAKPREMRQGQTENIDHLLEQMHHARVGQSKQAYLYDV